MANNGDSASADLSLVHLQIATEARDLILTPPPTDPYTIFKKELVKRNTESEHPRFNRKPSQFCHGDGPIENSEHNCSDACNNYKTVEPHHSVQWAWEQPKGAVI
ncbi:hypothetical protein HPB47_011740 [Ixodes persulcatus]|uniref:Uncharacterized protein n=1 Tax=Ixodes persulcatus TaxID=34615 RepID=A0AC60NVI8_IXOPE|nr:hypothetical protein HPB47_011740 [Ixodes persulcatus]